MNQRWIIHVIFRGKALGTILSAMNLMKINYTTNQSKYISIPV